MDTGDTVLNETFNIDGRYKPVPSLAICANVIEFININYRPGFQRAIYCQMIETRGES